MLSKYVWLPSMRIEFVLFILFLEKSFKWNSNCAFYKIQLKVTITSTTKNYFKKIRQYLFPRKVILLWMNFSILRQRIKWHVPLSNCYLAANLDKLKYVHCFIYLSRLDLFCRPICCKCKWKFIYRLMK